MTLHEFTDMTKLLSRDLRRPPATAPGGNTPGNDPLKGMEPKTDADFIRLALPERFTLQAYIQPKLDARYITYFNDLTGDRLMGLRPDIEFEVTASKYHDAHRIDDYYTKIKI